MPWPGAVQEPLGVVLDVTTPAHPTSPQMAVAWLVSRCVLVWTAVSSIACHLKLSQLTPILKDDACWCFWIWRRCLI